DEGVALLENLRSSIGSDFDKTIEEMLGSEEFDELKHQDLYDITPKILLYLTSQNDLSRAREVFAKYIHLAEDAVQKRLWRYNHGELRSHGGALLGNLLNSQVDDYQKVLLALDLLSAPIGDYEIEI